MSDSTRSGRQRAHELRARIGTLERAETERKQAEEELRESRRALSTLMSNLPGMAYRCRNDRDWTMEFVSEGCRALTGYEAGDLIGNRQLSYNEVIHPDDREQVWKGVQAALEQQRPFQLVYRIQTCAGQEKWVWEQGRGVFSPDGALLALEGFITDITDRTRAEQALRESSTLLRTIINATKEAMITIGEDGLITLFNAAAEEMFARSRDEMMGQPLGCLMPEEYRERHAGYVRSYFETRNPHGAIGRVIELPGLRSDGTVFPMAISLSAGRYGDKQFVIAVARDITEHKRAEEALRKSEANYRAIFDTANDGIFVHDAKTGAILDANRRVYQMYGYTPQEARNLTVGQLSANDPPYTQREAMERIRAAADGEPQLFEWLSRAKSGRLFWVEVNLKRAVIGGEERLLAIVRDISERKQADEERRNLEAQIQHAQKLESLGVMAGGLAHDFNNLLVSVLGYAGLAEMELPADSPARENIQRIGKAAQRAADLTRQMLAYSGKGRFVVEPVSLSNVVAEMTDLMSASISKNAILRYRFADDLPVIEADATQLRQVVMNLITNAADAIGDEAGVITVATGVTDADADYLAEAYLGDSVPPGPYAYIEVLDTGCGMDEETKAKVFDPFFSTKFAGRGLGLAAVLGIVRGHRGAIKLDAQPGRGTTFKVLFPCAGHVPAEPTPEQDAARPAEYRGAGTVLVVDDEEMVRAVAKLTLQRSGFSVLTASDGNEALRVYREHGAGIAAVVLDVTMPRPGGEEVLGELRRIRPDVRVILSRGYDEQDATARFADKGLARFLQKPYLPSTLVAKVREALAD
jgi:two-component system cell cycle sensor histidine kinase/response regulator CckA